MLIFSKELLLASGDLHGSYEWTTPGTYSFTIPRNLNAKVWIVGCGADRHVMSGYSYAGGSGAAFIGRINFPAGSYSVKVGNTTTISSSWYGSIPVGDSSILSGINGNLIEAGGGTRIDYPYSSKGGTLTLSSNLAIVSGSVELESNGNDVLPDYTAANGGASLYNGWGKGSDKTISNYTTGYFKIEW